MSLCLVFSELTMAGQEEKWNDMKHACTTTTSQQSRMTPGQPPEQSYSQIMMMVAAPT
jgi:hypothetical protein